MKLASATTLSTDSVAHGRGVRRIFMSTGDEGRRSIFLLRFLQICQKGVNRKSRKIKILYRKQGAGFAFEQVAHNLIGDRTKTKRMSQTAARLTSAASLPKGLRVQITSFRSYPST